jgi:hypothetical protein
VPEEGVFPKQCRSDINALFNKSSPWEAIKVAGEAAIPAGDATNHYRKLRDMCAGFGLWIVPVGELEGFCRSVGNHGPRWVRQVIEERDLATDAELEQARTFVRKLWNSRLDLAPKPSGVPSNAKLPSHQAEPMLERPT